MTIMDNGNDPPARIACVEISDENTIPTNSGLIMYFCMHANSYT